MDFGLACAWAANILAMCIFSLCPKGAITFEYLFVVEDPQLVR